MTSDTQTDMTYMHTISLSDTDMTRYIGIYDICIQRHIKSYLSMIIMSQTVKTIIISDRIARYIRCKDSMTSCTQTYEYIK